MTNCENCRKKIGTASVIKCKYCDMNLCHRCLQLEIHSCKNIQDSIKIEKDVIEKSLKPNKNPSKVSNE